MLTHARWHNEFIHTLHLGTLFKSDQLQCRSASDQGGNSLILSAIFEELGADPCTAGTVEHSAEASSRAAAIITDWMTYLPKDCVKAMVNSGWHWST